jgi:Methyltransferase FkbM domain
VSLDELVAQQIIDPDRTSLVWMDVQGHEGEVILGAGELVRRRVPIVFAFRPRRLRRAEEMVALLEENYTTLVDLRRPDLKEGWQADAEPIGALRQRLADRDSTDFLVFAHQGRSPAQA